MQASWRTWKVLRVFEGQVVILSDSLSFSAWSPLSLLVHLLLSLSWVWLSSCLRLTIWAPSDFPVQVHNRDHTECLLIVPDSQEGEEDCLCMYHLAFAMWQTTPKLKRLTITSYFTPKSVGSSSGLGQAISWCWLSRSAGGGPMESLPLGWLLSQWYHPPAAYPGLFAWWSQGSTKERESLQSLGGLSEPAYCILYRLLAKTSHKASPDSKGEEIDPCLDGSSYQVPL